MYILNYTCITAAGRGSEALMEALYAGRDCSQPAEPQGRICSLGPKSGTYREFLQNEMQTLWRELITPELRPFLEKSRVGLVFSSTKGFIEDYIWTTDGQTIRAHQDPFSGVVTDFCQASGISWALSCNLSNACSSSHVALEYIQDLFSADCLDYCVLIAADLVGPFIFKGFQSLKLISPTRHRPFAGDRDGLQLGEAVGLVLLARQQRSPLRLNKVASETEGASITRPSFNGDSLLRAFENLCPEADRPDAVIAHGTGTRFNDQAEELALRRFLKNKAPITATKWAIGHTLGASGCIDLIAGAEVLRRQKMFGIANTPQPDPSFQMNYLTAEAPLPVQDYRKILISSLGFGGVHAALLLELS